LVLLPLHPCKYLTALIDLISDVLTRISMDPSILSRSCNFPSLFSVWRPSSPDHYGQGSDSASSVSRLVILAARSALTQIHSHPLFALQCFLACDKGRLNENENVEVRKGSEVTTSKTGCMHAKAR
jgi:hypothetical protein